MTTRPPLVIVGPTASGKSALALAVARDHPRSEIVSVDAMAVYRGMDIGTTKPSAADRTVVPHHLIDLVEPTDEFTVSDFQRVADSTIAEIEARGGAPILVGGTGLYVRAVVDRLDIPGRYPEVRSRLEAEADTEQLHRRLGQLDPLASERIEAGNRRRTIRALEVTLGSGRPFSSFGPGLMVYPPSRFVQVGLDLDREELDRRIDVRFDRFLEDGLLDEVRALSTRGRFGPTAGQALGYRELRSHVDDGVPLDQAVAEAKRRTRRFARRQQRWFRRDPRIHWFDALDSSLVSAVETWWGESSG